MDLGGSIFDNIKIEADSDCAFFGLASTTLSEVTANEGVILGDYSSTTNNARLSTLLSSVSPYSISNSGPTNNVVTSIKPTSSSEACTPTMPTTDSSIDDSLRDALFASDIVEQLELDLPEFTCDFDILEDDGFMDTTAALMREDSDSKDSGTSSTTPDAYLSSPSSMDTPPLTPPSPVVKMEMETKSCLASASSNVGPMLKNIPNGANLAKILPAIKSSRGRSASHDSPDVQALKRHIRMIRNRESASLSRKKKKEYVTSLEDRLRELETENSHLKQENQLLKTKLLMQNQPVCSPSATSLRAGGTSLPNNATGRIGPNANKTKLIAKVALLGVCCFMILSAHAPFSRHHSIRPDEISNSTGESKVLQNFATHPDFPRHHLTEFPTNHLRISRSLAWQDDFKDTRSKSLGFDESEEKLIKVNRTSLDAPYDRREANKTKTTTQLSRPRYPAQSHSVKHSFKHSFNNASLPLQDIPDVPNASNCKVVFNKTESLRVQNDLIGLFSRGKPKKKKYAPTKPFFYSVMDFNHVNTDNNKGLTVYDQRMQRYSSFLDKFQLREDTFYVVSLAMDDQLLLSAKSSNASSRPKMSFLMPWRNDSLGGKEEMMQIDCEVTKVLNLNVVRKAATT